MVILMTSSPVSPSGRERRVGTSQQSALVLENVIPMPHQDDGDKDQENLMYLHPLLSLPCQKRPWQVSSLLTGPDADAESSLVPYGFVLLHVVLDQLKGSEALEEKSVCRKEKNYFFPPFSGGKGWKKIVLQLLLNTVEAGDQKLRPDGLSWGYEGVHITTGTPKNGL